MSVADAPPTYEEAVTGIKAPKPPAPPPPPTANPPTNNDVVSIF